MAAEQPKFKKLIEAADTLSLGISMVVAVLIGFGIGYGLKTWTGYQWTLWLGIFWGVAAAVLNVYKAYKKQMREYEELAKDPKYSNQRPIRSEDDEDEDEAKTI